MVRNVYLRNRPNRSRYGREKGGKFKFWPFRPLKRRLFWLVFWHCMAGRWCPMQFGGARWSLGGPGWSLGAARGLSGGYRAQTEGFRKFGKRCFLPPGTKRGGLGGILPPIIGLAGPGACRGGFGGSSPHYRVKMGRPLVPRGGFGGILPPF